MGGQAGEGLGPVHLHPALRPGGPQGLPEHRDRLPRRLPVRLRRQGRHRHAVGPERGKQLYELDAGSEINCLVFSPNRYWLCAATKKNIKIYDLETKSTVAELEAEFEETTSKRALEHYATSLAWSADGSTLYA